MKPAHAGIALFVVLIWASNVVAARVGATEIPPWFLVSMRMAVIAVTLIWFVRLPRGYILRIVPLSVTLGTLHFGLMTLGARTLEAGTVTIGLQTTVPFASILAWILFRETLGWRRAGGIAIAFCGILSITGEPKISAHAGTWALVLLSAFCFAVANMQLRAFAGVNVFALNAAIALFAAPQMLLVSWVLESGQIDALRAASWPAILSIIYMGLVVSVLGHGLWYTLVTRYPTNQIVPFTLLLPVFGVILGAVILDERITPLIALGGAVTIAGVAMVVVRRLPFGHNRAVAPPCGEDR